MSLFKRNKTWWTDFSVNGARYRLSLDTSDWREAQSREKEKIAEAQTGKLTPQTQSFARLAFPEAVARWLEEKRPRVAPKTHVTELERANAPKQFFGQARLKDITSEAVLAYMRQRSEQGLSNATINRELDIIRGVLKRARLWYRMADDVKPLPARSNIGRALSMDEEARLLRIAASRPEWNMVRLAMVLALNTTCRGCELKGLHWRDVDFLGRTIAIRRSKTEAGIRTIPLNANAWKAILALRERAMLLFGENLNLDWYVFFRREGFSKAEPDKPAETWRTAWRSLTRAIECPACGLLQPPRESCANEQCKADLREVKSSLAGLRFHDLRHTAITKLAESQTSDSTIMAIAGHVSDTMLRHYSHIRQEAMRRALDGLAWPAAEGGYVTNHVTNRVGDAANSLQVSEKIGGADGIRTHDLLDAIEARSQLRHGPTEKEIPLNFYSIPPLRRSIKRPNQPKTAVLWFWARGTSFPRSCGTAAQENSRLVPRAVCP